MRENKPLEDSVFQNISELEQRIEALQEQNELLIAYVMRHSLWCFDEMFKRTTGDIVGGLKK